VLKVRRWLARNRTTPFTLMLDLGANILPDTGSIAAQRADHLILYNLFGDPALTSGVVRRSAALEAPATATVGEVLTLGAAARFMTGTAHFSLTIPRTAMLTPVTPVQPNQRGADEAMIRTHARANNKVVLEQHVPIKAGRARWTVRLPGTSAEIKVHIDLVNREIASLSDFTD